MSLRRKYGVIGEITPRASDSPISGGMLTLNEHSLEAYSGTLHGNPKKMGSGTRVAIAHSSAQGAVYSRVSTKLDGIIFYKMHGERTAKTEPAHTGDTYYGVEFSPDGKKLVYATNAGLYFFSYDHATDTYTKLNTANGTAGRSIAFSNNGDYIVTCNAAIGTMAIYKWNPATGADNITATVLSAQPAGTIYTAEFSPDDNYLAVSTSSSTGGYVRIVKINKTTDPWTFTLLTATAAGMPTSGGQPASAGHTIKWAKTSSGYSLFNHSFVDSAVSIWTKDAGANDTFTKSSITPDVTPGWAVNTTYCNNCNFDVGYQAGRIFLAFPTTVNPNFAGSIDIYEYIPGTSLNRLSTTAIPQYNTGQIYGLRFSPDASWILCAGAGQLGYGVDCPTLVKHDRGTITYTNHAAISAPNLATTSYVNYNIAWGT